MENNKKGIAMLLVLSLIIMLLMLGGAVLMVSTGHFGTSWHQIRRARAYYAAEAAMQHILWDLRTNGVTPGDYTSLPDGFDVNGITKADFEASTSNGSITISDLDANIPGVHTIDIVVDY